MHLTLHLTRSCNMHCRYCYAPPTDGAPMSEQTGRQAMKLGAVNNRGSCGIVFFGGEPLLHKDLIRALVAYGRSMQAAGEGRFHYKITTNGVLLDEVFLDFARREQVQIAMSFDGVREAHDAHRRMADGSGTFDLLLDRLKLLLAFKPYASVIMVVNPDTARYLAEGVSFLLDVGARYLIVALNYAADWRESDLAVLERQYLRLGRLYVRWTRQGRKFYLSPFEVKFSSHINADCFDRERCDLGARQISVDPEGYLYPCVQFHKAGPQSRWCVGHVRHGIDVAALAAVRAEAQREKARCRECALRGRCAHTCACLNWQATGTVTQVSDALCAHERMLTPIVDRVGNILYRRREPLFIQKHYNRAYPALSLLEDAISVGHG